MKKILLISILLFVSTFNNAQAYNEASCKKALDYKEMLWESKELSGFAKSIIDVAKRLENLDQNANTDFFIAGVYGNYIANNLLQVSYALKLLPLIDKAKLASIGNDELFKNHVSSLANSFEPVINTVANHYVIEKNPAAREELVKLKNKLEKLSQKYAFCKS